ncbi:hypothetical protein [Lacticaseibacillus jixiensis]|uniref:hypothetical protein n=1 Tax=Lacticaseibacillus jixiensis TaxID=3231926 RepID=UPI0036F318EA
MIKTQVKEVLHSNRSRKEKLQYLLQIYWWIGAIIIAAVVLIGAVVIATPKKKASVLDVTVLTSQNQPNHQADMTKAFNKWVKYDHRSHQLNVIWGTTSDAAAQEKFITTLAAGDVDLVISDQKQYRQYAKDKGLAPLPLTKAQLSRLHDDLMFDKRGHALGVRVEASPQLRKWQMKNLVLYVPIRYNHKANIKQVVRKLFEP